uniref:C2 domain-containing protein n=1 Tax=Terrapene triunguis TaxID=2587831 RepID=A0A674K224_9SAUR
MRILFLDAPEVCHTPRPCAPGQSDVETSTFAGSSVDLPPRPSRASPDAQFGTESVIRIHLLEAENLIAKDNFMGGMIRGKSDPYAKVRLGGHSFRSHVVKEELSPRWNEVYEVIVNEVPGQEVEFEIYDKDIDKDDFLGRCKIALKRVLSSRFIDEWLPLEDVKSGRLHVRLECLTPTPNGAELEQVLMINSLTQTQRSAELSSALLSVFLDRAADLPGGPGLTAFTGSPPQTITSTSEPVWDEGFSFLVKRPHVESLELQVKDEGGQGLGALSLPLTQLLAAETLTLDRWFPLSRAGPGGQVLLRVQLGILVSQHSGVEPRSAPAAGEEAESPPGGLEPELYVREDGDPGGVGPAQELRQRLTHADRWGAPESGGGGGGVQLESPAPWIPSPFLGDPGALPGLDPALPGAATWGATVILLIKSML